MRLTMSARHAHYCRQLAVLSAFALVVACGQSEGSADAGADVGTDGAQRDAAKCTTPEADGLLPTYQWSFNQQTLLENNALISLPPGSVIGNGFDFGSDLGCGEYLVASAQDEQTLGDLAAYPPVPQRWRLSAWFRGSSDGTIFDFEGIHLTIQAGMLSVVRTGATSPAYATSLNVGDGAWHAVALQIDATTAPLSIQVFVDKTQSSSAVSWTPDLASTYLRIGGKVDPTSPENDLDEVSVFF